MEFLNKCSRPGKSWNFTKRHGKSWNLKMAFYFIYCVLFYILRKRYCILNSVIMLLIGQNVIWTETSGYVT